MQLQDARVISHLFSLKGVGAAKVGRLLLNADKSRLTLSEALLSDEGRAMFRQTLREEQIESLLTPDEAISHEISWIETHKIAVMALTDEAYPCLLKRAGPTCRPPILMLMGNLGLLTWPAVGFCGSRKASEKGLTTARDIASQLAQRGIVVVSGYAAGVDQATHHAALSAGGSTIIVLPEGLMAFRLKSFLKDVWDWNRTLVVSEFPTTARWSVGRAMQRNKTLVGLCHAMVLIEAGEKGGSISAGRAALEMKRPLFAPVYLGMPPTATGNRVLLEQGALPLMKSRATGHANIERIINALPGVSHKCGGMLPSRNIPEETNRIQDRSMPRRA